MKQTFGLEFEYASKTPQTQTAARLQAAFKKQFKDTAPNPVLLRKHNVDQKHFAYHEHDLKLWGVEYDASIRVSKTHTVQTEIISPILTQNDFPAIKVALEAVKPYAQLNSSCGLHCHVGVTKREHAARCALLWYISEPLIVDVFPLNRSTNHYCKMLTDTPYELIGLDDTGRYGMLNTESWRTRKTVEFRGHSGTLNYQKVKKWVLFCLSFVRLAHDMHEAEMKKFLNGEYKHLNFDIFNMLDIKNTKTRRYFLHRIEHFNKGKQKRLRREQANNFNRPNPVCIGRPRPARPVRLSNDELDVIGRVPDGEDSRSTS